MNVARYLEAERRLWESEGVTPHERTVRLPRLNVDVRVLEAGDGPPVLFVHGSLNAASTWASLVARLTGLRCLVLDRPGAGLSAPYPVTVETFPGFADTLIADTLDALEIERAAVAGSSFGGYIALRAAIAHPGRVPRLVLLGCPAFVPGVLLPSMMKVLLFPGMSRLIPALPARERDLLRTFRQMGHGASLDAGKFPREFRDWYLAMQRDTDTMRHEMRILAALGSWRGFDPALALSPDDLRSVTTPTHLYWGEDDTFGGADVARGLAALLPNATLDLVPSAGHLPWLDDPDGAARAVREHLLGA